MKVTCATCRFYRQAIEADRCDLEPEPRDTRGHFWCRHHEPRNDALPGGLTPFDAG